VKAGARKGGPGRWRHDALLTRPIFRPARPACGGGKRGGKVGDVRGRRGGSGPRGGLERRLPCGPSSGSSPSPPVGGTAGAVGDPVDGGGFSAARAAAQTRASAPLARALAPPRPRAPLCPLRPSARPPPAAPRRRPPAPPPPSPRGRHVLLAAAPRQEGPARAHLARGALGPQALQGHHRADGHQGDGGCAARRAGRGGAAGRRRARARARSPPPPPPARPSAPRAPQTSSRSPPRPWRCA